MNIKKKANLYTIILLGFIFLQIGCFKDKIDERRVLSDKMKSQNPYHENDKLYFKSNDGHESILEVSYRNDDIFEYSSGNYSPVYLVEIEKTSIGSTGGTGQFSFLLEMNGYYTPPKFDIQFTHTTKGSMLANYDLPLSINTSGYTHSVYINGKWYSGIFIKEIPKKDSSAYKLYYSTELGIIGIEFSDSSSVVLQKIEKANEKTTGNKG